MKQGEAMLINPLGLHARPAAQFVQTAGRFKGTSVKIIKETREFDAKSIIGIMSLGAKKGTVLTIRTEGPDETEAVKTFVDLIASGFGQGE